jgi:hypothetical protein
MLMYSAARLLSDEVAATGDLTTHRRPTDYFQLPHIKS